MNNRTGSRRTNPALSLRIVHAYMYTSYSSPSNIRAERRFFLDGSAVDMIQRPRVCWRSMRMRMRGRLIFVNVAFFLSVHVALVTQ